MNTIPLVSILVTTYNQEEYIAQTLDSILMQQCSFEYEIIIGEDCSTDRTRNICLEYRDNYPDKIVLCLNEKNKGLLDNYFDVFLKCQGEFIADCGGDDYWLTSHKLQDQVDLLIKYPNVSLVASNWLMLHQKTGLLENGTSHVSEDWFKSDCFGKKAVSSYLNETIIPRVVLASSCFRKDLAFEAYHKHPELFRSESVTCEDMPLTLCLLMKGPFYFQNETFMVYRVLEKSLSHSFTVDEYMKGFAFKTYKQVVGLALTLGLQTVEIDCYIQRWAGHFALHAFLTGNHHLFSELIRFLDEINFPLKAKHRILKSLMFVPGLFHITKWLYISIKHLALN